RRVLFRSRAVIAPGFRRQLPGPAPRPAPGPVAARPRRLAGRTVASAAGLDAGREPPGRHHRGDAAAGAGRGRQPGRLRRLRRPAGAADRHRPAAVRGDRRPGLGQARAAADRPVQRLLGHRRRHPRQRRRQPCAEPGRPGRPRAGLGGAECEWRGGPGRGPGLLHQLGRAVAAPGRGPGPGQCPGLRHARAGALAGERAAGQPARLRPGLRLQGPRRHAASGQGPGGALAMNETFAPGQRWFSSAEPELGLGTVLRLAGRQVQIVFTGSGVVRMYALGSAPLLRAEFRPGERIRVSGEDKLVERVERRAGLLHYHCGNDCHPEGELDAEQPVSQADARLLSGRVDRNDQFEFRLECLRRRAEARAHPGWGILGARIDLIPHQLRVAAMAASRRPPRLLLADEVGLGKTIEACMVVAQQLASGRARRVLVLAPESLVNQWFVELLRRFNLPFAIYDEERCESLELTEPRANPFEDEQCVIASVDWLASHERRARQAREAGWDLLLVDEAHHLSWGPDYVSPAYALVEDLSLRTPGLLLLTATPEQLGLGGHFARLRLLDPARYTDLEHFRAEMRGYLALSPLAGRLAEGEALTTADMETLARLFPDEGEQLASRLGRIAAGDTAERESLLADLVDRHGTGRVMVRNRRAAVGGFPRRIPHVETLPAPEDPLLLGRLRAEFCHVVGDTEDEAAHDFTRDPRMDWLLRVLEETAPAKVLLLCRSRAKVQAIDEALRLRSGLQVARFHEDMNLLQRDRNAAFFADPEGARLLVASEIGAEGRNFQFAQHLVFWDLPLHPDMLEQRIGRLDRIGQRGDVHLHAA